MKFYNILMALVVGLTFAACSPERQVIQVVKGDTGAPGADGTNGTNGTSCSVAPELDSETFAVIGARISCTDGSSSIILNGAQGPQGVQGLQGAQGAQGVAGQNGASCSVSRGPHSSYATIYCPFSVPVRVYDGQDGEDGRDGTSCSVSQTSNGAKIKCGSSVAFIYNGTNGTNGSNGTSCSVSSVPNGAKITCGATSQIVYNGQDGADGQDGLDSPLANALGIAAILKPCGNEFDNDEVLMKLTDNSVLALYDGGANLDRLTILVPGLEYRTTDRNGNGCCKFKLTSSGDFAYNATYNNNQCN